jgi:hypothetical protein
MISSPSIDAYDPAELTPALAERLEVERRVRQERSDHPGRWLGGVVGALTSAAAAGVLYRISGETDPTKDAATVIALLGIPIAFALGRALLPEVRSGGWGWGLWIGIAVGLIAPPIGAVVILVGPALGPAGVMSTDFNAFNLAILPIALPFSYVAVPITIPVGLVWALVARWLPEDDLSSLRAPRGLERLGVRHALLVLVVWAVIVQLVSATVR